jgi:hypothetical protein
METEVPFSDTSKILKIGYAVDAVYIWIEHPMPLQGNVGGISIYCHGTGYEFNGDNVYIDSVIDPGGFVWHYYHEPLE